MHNFLDPRLMPKVSCSAPSTEHFEVSNLISNNEVMKTRGFIAYTVIKPPIEIEFEFLCAVEIDCITMQTTVGQQKCTGIEIFAKDKTYFSIGKAFFDGPGLTFCCSRKYSKQNPPLYSHNPNYELFFFKKDTWRILRNATFLKVVIFRTNRCVPCLGSVQVYGTVAQSCSDTTKCTIDRLMTASSSKVTEKNVKENLSVKESFDIPADFIDDLTCEIMAMPMTLPSGKTIDKETLDKHIENEKSFHRKPGDPFTGLKFTETLKPILNVALKSRIDMFLLQNSAIPATFKMKRTLGSQTNYAKKLKRDQCLCKKEDNLYVIPCGHFFCRDCLLRLDQFLCHSCQKDFMKSDAKRYHH